MKFIAAFLLGATLMLLLCDWAGAEERTWYVCTSKPYQLTFGSSITCPNAEQKIRHELYSYMRWLYSRDVPKDSRSQRDAKRQAMEAYRSFRCEFEVRQ